MAAAQSSRTSRTCSTVCSRSHLTSATSLSSTGYHLRRKKSSDHDHPITCNEDPNIHSPQLRPTVSGPPRVPRTRKPYSSDLAQILVAVVRYFKLLFPQKKKDPTQISEEQSKVISQEDTSKAKRLENRVYCQWAKDGQAGWKVNRVLIPPYLYGQSRPASPHDPNTQPTLPPLTLDRHSTQGGH